VPAREAQKPQAYASDGTDAIGFTQFWGNSPGFDLRGEDYNAVKTTVSATGSGEEGEKKRLNILTTFAADIRHVLKTAAGSFVEGGEEEEQPEIHFYMHESQAETIARHVFFLKVINDETMGVRERAELFLSVYGNSLVRERDAQYLHESVKLLEEVVNGDSDHALSELIDFSTMKYRDSDEVQDVIHNWVKNRKFDAEAMRDHRCRGFWRSRFDYRKNLMDWDYQTVVKEHAPIIHWQLFKQFGHTGVAFETRIATYSEPNRTLASYTPGMSGMGDSIALRGFWADIVNTPYWSFGTDCHPKDKPRLFKKINEQLRNNALDISEFNLMALMNELRTGHTYHLPAERPEENQFPQASPMDFLRQSVIEEVDEEEAEKDDSKGVLLPGLKNVKVHFLTGDLSAELKKTKYNNFFHRAYIGALGLQSYINEADLLKDGKPIDDKEVLFRGADSPLATSLKDGAVVTVESMKYQVHIQASIKIRLRATMEKACRSLGWIPERKARIFPKFENSIAEHLAKKIENVCDPLLHFTKYSPDKYSKVLERHAAEAKAVEAQLQAEIAAEAAAEHDKELRKKCGKEVQPNPMDCDALIPDANQPKVESLD